MLMPLMFLIGFLLCLGIAESLLHRRRLAHLPIRIHINGSRGKSSVTRLIAVALREAGISTLAKTTGSLPQLILPDGREQAIVRAGAPSIREQISLVRTAARLQVRALVVECMAVQPVLQWVSEHRMLRSTLGVMTAIRPDHLDVFGATEHDVGQALTATVPRRGTLILGDHRFAKVFRQTAQKRRSDLILAEAGAPLAKAELADFSYIEHPENIALALTVCQHLGLDRARSLAAMKKVRPDPGALQFWKVTLGQKPIQFVSGFSANDPVSTAAIWHLANQTFPDAASRVVVMNGRNDRMQRSIDLAKGVASWTNVDVCLVVGEGAMVFEKHFRRLQPDVACINLGGKALPAILQHIETQSKPRGLVVGIGNFAGIGMDLVKWMAP